MTAKIKLNAASGGGSFSLQAPSSSANNRVIALPDIADGTLLTSQSTLDATKLSGNLPALNGSALTNLPAGGKFLQIVGAVQTSNVQIVTTTSYIDTGLTCNITTSASGHAGVLVLVNGALGGMGNTSGGEGVAQMNLVRGSTQLTEVVRGSWAGNVSGQQTETYGATPMNFYDTGTSASTTYTYKVQFKKISNADYAKWNKYNGASTIYLIEVGS